MDIQEDSNTSGHVLENEQMKKTEQDIYIMGTKARRDLTKDVLRYTEYGKRDFKNHPPSD